MMCACKPALAGHQPHPQASAGLCKLCPTRVHASGGDITFRNKLSKSCIYLQVTLLADTSADQPGPAAVDLSKWRSSQLDAGACSLSQPGTLEESSSYNASIPGILARLLAGGMTGAMISSAAQATILTHLLTSLESAMPNQGERSLDHLWGLGRECAEYQARLQWPRLKTLFRC